MAGPVKTRLVPVPAAQVREFWPQAEPWVRDAVLRGATIETVEFYAEQVASRHAQLWMITDDDRVIGCGITQIYPTSKGLTCAVPIVACERMDVVLFDVVERWAREQGCVRLEGYGRPGWARALKTSGWNVVAVCIEKDLRHG